MINKLLNAISKGINEALTNTELDLDNLNQKDIVSNNAINDKGKMDYYLHIDNKEFASIVNNVINIKSKFSGFKLERLNNIPVYIKRFKNNSYVNTYTIEKSHWIELADWDKKYYFNYKYEYEVEIETYYDSAIKSKNFNDADTVYNVIYNKVFGDRKRELRITDIGDGKKYNVNTNGLDLQELWISPDKQLYYCLLMDYNASEYDYIALFGFTTLYINDQYNTVDKKDYKALNKALKEPSEYNEDNKQIAMPRQFYETSINGICAYRADYHGNYLTALLSNISSFWDFYWHTTRSIRNKDLDTIFKYMNSITQDCLYINNRDIQKRLAIKDSDNYDILPVMILGRYMQKLKFIVTVYITSNCISFVLYDNTNHLIFDPEDYGGVSLMCSKNELRDPYRY